MSQVHPLIRIFTLLIIVAFLSFGNAWHLLLATILVLSLAISLKPQVLSSGLRLLRFLRLFFISLLIFYGWFTPGVPLGALAWPEVAVWMPTYEGLQLAFYRGGVLVAIFFTVHLMVSLSSTGELFNGIYSLLRPLDWLGLQRQTVAVRMSLTLHKVSDFRAAIEQLKTTFEQTQAPFFERSARSLAFLINEATANEKHHGNTVEVEYVRRPDHWQWLIPATIIVLFGLFS